jgi:hypothetical protein
MKPLKGLITEKKYILQPQKKNNILTISDTGLFHIEQIRINKKTGIYLNIINTVKYKSNPTDSGKATFLLERQALPSSLNLVLIPYFPEKDGRHLRIHKKVIVICYKY